MSKPEKKNTNVYRIKKIMSDALSDKQEKKLSGLYDRRDNPLPRTSISMYVKKIKDTSFPGANFYTRQLEDGSLVIGCYGNS